jgi:hypothetical protein
LLVSATYKNLDQLEIRAGRRARGEYESSGGNSLSGLAGRQIDDFMYATLGKIAKPFPGAEAQ